MSGTLRSTRSTAHYNCFTYDDELVYREPIARLYEEHYGARHGLAWVKRMHEGYIFVLAYLGVPVGIMSAFELIGFRDDIKYGTVDLFYVREEHRRQSGKLFRYAIGVAKDLGVQCVMTHVKDEYVRFWERHGMTKTDNVMEWEVRDGNSRRRRRGHHGNRCE